MQLNYRKLKKIFEDRGITSYTFKRLFSNILKPFQKKRKESKGGDLEGRM